MKWHLQSICWLLCLSGLTANAFGQQKVLVVHSYHEGFEWVDQINLGIAQALKDTGFTVETIFMDTKRRSDEAWKIQAGKMALNRVNDFKPDLIIAADDNAQAYFASELSHQPDSPPIVFCGLNGKPQDYGYPNSKVTGILESPQITATLRLAHALQPTIKRFTLITDNSITSVQIVRYCKTLKMPLELVSIEIPENFTQWQEMVRKANQQSDAILVALYHTVKPTSISPTSMPPSDVMHWTVNNSKIPVLGLYPFTVKDGAAIGISASPMEHGYLAACIARSVLKTGNRISDYPLNTAVEGEIMFNLASARRWQITIPPHLMKMAKLLVRQ